MRKGGLGANFVSVKPEDSASTSLHLIFSSPIPVNQDGRLLPDRRQEGRLPRRKWPKYLLPHRWRRRSPIPF